jgi:hypothetical protein
MFQSIVHKSSLTVNVSVKTVYSFLSKRCMIGQNLNWHWTTFVYGFSLNFNLCRMRIGDTTGRTNAMVNGLAVS